MIQVVPAIIPHTREQMEEEFHKLRFAPLVQVDICDGVFVGTKTWPYNGRDLEYFENLKKEEEGWPEWEDCEVELHLMVKDPEQVLSDWIKTGISSVVAHIEATENFQNIVDICRENSVSVGIAIKPSTDPKKLESFASQVDFIQCMGSNLLGKHGVELDDSALVQIKRLHELYPERIIAIDIGVTEETRESLVEAGATKLISGSEILNAEDPEDEFHDLES